MPFGISVYMTNPNIISKLSIIDELTARASCHRLTSIDASLTFVESTVVVSTAVTSVFLVQRIVSLNSGKRYLLIRLFSKRKDSCSSGVTFVTTKVKTIWTERIKLKDEWGFPRNNYEVKALSYYYSNSLFPFDASTTRTLSWLRHPEESTCHAKLSL